LALSSGDVNPARADEPYRARSPVFTLVSRELTRNLPLASATAASVGAEPYPDAQSCARTWLFSEQIAGG